MVSALRRRHDVRIVSTVLPYAPERRDESVGVIEIPRPERDARRGKLRRFCALLAGRSTWASDWRSPRFDREAHMLVGSCDIVHVEFLLLADSVRRAPGNRAAIIVTDHDLPLFSTLDQVRRDRWWFRPYPCSRSSPGGARIGAPRTADAFVVFTSGDRKRIERLVGNTPVFVVPFPVPLPARGSGLPEPDKPAIGYIGKYTRPENLRAVERLIERLMPIVWLPGPT